MLKKLQRKFIILTTLISIIVMIFIAVAINVINYNSILSHSDEVLDVLLEEDPLAGEILPPKPGFSREFAFTTRFFLVNTDENGQVDSVDTRNISTVSSDEAVEYVYEVEGLGETTGNVGDFRYIKEENDIGHTYIFLDIEEEIMGFKNYLLYSVVIVFSAVVLIFILSCFLSKKAVSPIVESYEKQKRFITDVSHEFKTPLAIIKADCDVIEIDNGEDEWTTSIKSQILRLGNLVEDLISLAKFDEEKSSIIKTDFSLSDALNDTVTDFSSAIKNANLDIDTEITKNITYNGDETFIRKLFAILIENAIKYSEGYVKVYLSTVGNKKIFWIENSCESIKEGKYNNWFERFYRADESRNSENKGFGIGLSIAKNICDKHGGKITAESKTGKEIRITVIF